ncbi:MAG: peptidase M16 [Rhodospirillaceae bacterium]|jgi:zinc protease|nr:peptidase M16 [Rhodospirillaceae bacterium]|tara:strand:+ start:324 stop:1667 length:1344 start_codon:yes stop_codon:yes gene_type:complete
MTGKTTTFFAPLFLLVLLVGVLFAPPQAYAVTIERVLSPGGVEAWLVRDHTNPIITMRFAFRGGAALDPGGREGLANMVSALLDEGAGDLDSKTFQGRLEDLVITLRFDAGRDNFGGRLRTLVENKKTAFELLTLALTRPRFDAEPVARIRSQILSSLRQDAEDPNAIAAKTLFKTLFPAHPYGRPVDGTLESVAAITRTGLMGFVRRRLARDNLVIGVVGDITADMLKPVLDKTFGGLKDKARPWAIPEAALQGRGRTVVVSKPVPQSAIVFAGKGLKRRDRDFYAAYVMNHVLGGGGFTSRLYNTVREKRGLAYSVYSALHPLDRAGLIFGGAGTANKRASETIAVMRGEWKRMAAKGMSEKELADAKTFLTGSYPLRFTSSDRIASMLIGIQMDDLGIDYPDRRNGLIEAVTLADVNRLAKKLLRPDQLTVVVVGRPDGVKSTN